MLRSLYSGVSGLKAHQVRMDVIGNNIANVNTLGFKKSRVTFQDTFSQMLRGANRSEGDQGGVNPSQVGLGVTIGSVETLHTQGNLQNTGKTTDLAIDGQGYFILKDPEGGNVYTRVGGFDFDAKGFLVNPQGFKVQGYMADPLTGTIGTTLEDLTAINYLQSRSTDEVNFINNLDASSPIGTTVTVSKEVFDSLGIGHVVDFELQKTADNEWTYTVSLPQESAAVQATLANNTGQIIFDTNGRVDTTATSTANATALPVLFNNFTFTPDNPDANPMSVYPDFSELTQFGSKTTVIAQAQSGNPAGTIKELTIQTDGTIIGDFEGGYRRVLGKVALASFTNPAGLLKAGGNLYRSSGNSGDGVPGSPQTLGRGTIVSNALEMSNVDLAEEFTNMITTQRGFQANSRIITTSDELLQELVNLKR